MAAAKFDSQVDYFVQNVIKLCLTESVKKWTETDVSVALKWAGFFEKTARTERGAKAIRNAVKRLPKQDRSMHLDLPSLLGNSRTWIVKSFVENPHINPDVLVYIFTQILSDDEKGHHLEFIGARVSATARIKNSLKQTSSDKLVRMKQQQGLTAAMARAIKTTLEESKRKSENISERISSLVESMAEKLSLSTVLEVFALISLPCLVSFVKGRQTELGIDERACDCDGPCDVASIEDEAAAFLEHSFAKNHMLILHIDDNITAEVCFHHERIKEAVLQALKVRVDRVIDVDPSAMETELNFCAGKIKHWYRHSVSLQNAISTFISDEVARDNFGVWSEIRERGCKGV